MRILRIIRLTLWSLIITVCLLVLMSQLLLSRTLLDSEDMRSLVADTSIYDTVRQDILVPQVYTAAQNSEYAEIVTEEVVASAVDKTFDDATLEKLLSPTIQSFVDWLNSNRADLSLPVEARSELDNLNRTLAEGVASRISALPQCTWLNSLEDITQYICRPPNIEEDQVVRTVEQALQSDNRLQDDTFDILAFLLPDSTRRFIEPVPTYINILHSAAIFAAGVALLVGVWLLVRYRFIGMMTIGASGVVAAIAFGVLIYSIRGLPAQVALEPAYQKVVQSATSLIAQEAGQIAIVVTVTATALLAVGIAGVLYSRSRRTKHLNTVHLDEHQPLDE